MAQNTKDYETLYVVSVCCFFTSLGQHILAGGEIRPESEQCFIRAGDEQHPPAIGVQFLLRRCCRKKYLQHHVGRAECPHRRSARCLPERNILFREQPQTVEQQKFYKVQGKVVDEKNLPMPGVTVLLDGTQMGVSTNVDGDFTLSVPQEKGKLVFSFVGYNTVTVNYTDGKAVSVKMELETASLEEVQLVAYGAQKKRESRRTQGIAYP